jgi:hypothetical protein
MLRRRTRVPASKGQVAQQALDILPALKDRDSY